MTTPKVFFSRCKPYGHDAVEVALESNRLFFGYCMRKRDANYDRRNLRSCIVDITCDNATWAAEHFASDRSGQYNRNRNFVREIGPGSIALVPRPSSGVIYCGFVQGAFELADEPTWYDTWERIWRASTTDDPDEFWIAGEVAQTWRADKFRAIPVPRIPVWIRRSLFGRSTYGIVRPYGGMDPVEALKSILSSDSFIPMSWTTDPEDMERRLITDVTPSAFEHLVVSLLQLENPDEFWTHVGGYRYGTRFVQGSFGSEADLCNGIERRQGLRAGIGRFPRCGSRGRAAGNHCRLRRLASADCRPYVGFDYPNVSCCRANNSFVLRQIAHSAPERVLLHANWANAPELLPRLADMIKAIHEASSLSQVMILGGVPQWQPTLPETIIYHDLPISSPTRLVTDLASVDSADDIFAAIALENDARLVSVVEFACPDNRCLVFTGTPPQLDPFAWDYGHLTPSASEWVANRILDGMGHVGTTVRLGVPAKNR